MEGWMKGWMGGEMDKGEAAELGGLVFSDMSVHKRRPGREQPHAGCIPVIRLNLGYGRKSVILLPLCALVRRETRGACEKQIAFSVTSAPKKQQPTQM